MRAARTLSLDSTVVVDVPDPVCGPGEVVCRVLASATCGSDVHGWYVRRKLPAVLGHEPVGEVVETGAGVTRVAPGDVVAIHHHAACGACRVCAAGHETLCRRFRSTVDPATATGDDIVIEERDGDEVRRAGGALVTLEGTPVRNPAFDVTPAELVTAVVTEAGVEAR